MESGSRQPELSRTSLTPIVRQATGRPELNLVIWQCEALEPQLGEASGGVYHVTGSGHDAGAEVTRSLALKGVSGPKNISPSSNTRFFGDDVFAEPESIMYWKREGLASQSALLDDLLP